MRRTGSADSPDPGRVRLAPARGGREPSPVGTGCPGEAQVGPTAAAVRWPWPWALAAAGLGAVVGAVVAGLVHRLARPDPPEAVAPEDVQAVVDRPPADQPQPTRPELPRRPL